MGGEGVRYGVTCPECGGAGSCTAGAALMGGQIEWSYETSCPVCGSQVAHCGRGTIPEDLRVRLLAEHGPTGLRADRPPGGGAAAMKVLRAQSGGTPAATKATWEGILAGRWSGTLAEAEQLALRLRAGGVVVVTVRG
ncbi:hypothetical protein [Kitasatospora sp. NPDC094015]|uniref:hypothetical protein n=1 Tax=Kitasatospora sp. NPDC094015 TaxID=3155205 RepID=UPI00333084CC